MKNNLIKLLKSNDFLQLQFILEELAPEVIAKLLNKIPAKYLKTVVSLIERKKAIEVYSLLSGTTRRQLQDSFRKGYFSQNADETEREKIYAVNGYEALGDVIVEIIDLLEERDFSQLKPLLNGLYAGDVVEIFTKIDAEDFKLLFRFLTGKKAKEAFIMLPAELQISLFNCLNGNEVNDLLNGLEIEDLAEFIEKLPKKSAKKAKNSLTAERKQQLSVAENYVENSAGKLMSARFVYLKQDMTVKDCFEKIKTYAREFDNIYNCYVVNDDKTLLGIVSLKDLLLASPEEYAGKLMNRKAISATTAADDDEIAKLFIKYNLDALPITDENNVLSGVITSTDAVDIINKARAKELENMAGVVSGNENTYLNTGVWKIWLNRAPWLLILLISATFTGLIISRNEELLNMPTIGIVLTACIPMLMDTGGNAGCQSSATAIRSIALGELHFRDSFKAVWKETRVAFLVGITLSIVCFAKLMLIDRLYTYGNLGYIIAAVVCLSMSITVLLAKTMGCFLSLFIKKCRLDPAVIVSPFLTTIIDAVSLSIYCGFSTWILMPLVS